MGCMSCCRGLKQKKGLWSPDEDKKLIAYISEYGHGRWNALPMLAGLQRCGKSCRLRWLNYLKPGLKRGAFSLLEENLIIEAHAAIGNRWSRIANLLPGRTDNEIKNFWNTSIKKKLTQMGINPNNHKSNEYSSDMSQINEKIPSQGKQNSTEFCPRASVMETNIETVKSEAAGGVFRSFESHNRISNSDKESTANELQEKNNICHLNALLESAQDLSCHSNADLEVLSLIGTHSQAEENMGNFFTWEGLGDLDETFNWGELPAVIEDAEFSTQDMETNIPNNWVSVYESWPCFK